MFKFFWSLIVRHHRIHPTRRRRWGSRTERFNLAQSFRNDQVVFAKAKRLAIADLIVPKGINVDDLTEAQVADLYFDDVEQSWCAVTLDGQWPEMDAEDLVTYIEGARI